jgi:fumarate hydratase class I
MAKGGGSANKTYLFQETKALLNPRACCSFLDEKMRTLGTAACPPYHLAIVIGGTSARDRLKTAKLASPATSTTCPPGQQLGHAFRDLEMEQKVLELTQQTGHRRAVRRQVLLPRRARDPPAPPRRLAARSASACRARPTARRSARSPRTASSSSSSSRPGAVPARGHRRRPRRRRGEDRPQPADGRDPRDLTKYPVKTRVIAHRHDGRRARHRPRQAQGAARRGEGLPQYLKDHPVYYAGPAKTPEGMPRARSARPRPGAWTATSTSSRPPAAAWSCWPRATARKQVTDACKKHGGFYLGSIGGPAARLAQDCIKKVEVLEYPELGMEAVWRIEVEDFPAFIVVDDKGNDFFL